MSLPRDVGKIDVGLDDVAQTIETERAALHIFPCARDLERRLDAGVEDRAERSPPGMSGLVLRSADRNQEIRHERIGRAVKSEIFEVARLAVVGRAKADPRHDREPAEVSLSESELVEGVEAEDAVILEDRAGSGNSGSDPRSSFRSRKKSACRKAVGA